MESGLGRGGLLVRDLDVRHAGQGWALTAPADQGLDRAVVSLRLDFDAAVGPVPYEPVEPQAASLVAGLGSKAHPLHAPGDT